MVGISIALSRHFWRMEIDNALKKQADRANSFVFNSRAPAKSNDAKANCRPIKHPFTNLPTD